MRSLVPMLIHPENRSKQANTQDIESDMAQGKNTSIHPDSSSTQDQRYAEALPSWLMPAPVLVWSLTALIIAIICALGYGVFTYHKLDIQKQHESNLKLVASLKADLILRWLGELKLDAEALARYSVQGSNVAAWLALGGESGNIDLRQVEERLHLIEQIYHYDALFLLDAHGVPRISVLATSKAVDEEVRSFALSAMAGRQIAFHDMYLGEDDKPHMGWLVPLSHGTGKDSQVVGGIYFRTDPTQFLFPTLQNWPLVSDTAETLLIRLSDDQGDAVVLNQLRHRADSVLNLRIPIGRQDAPAARAALGWEGLFAGYDYRGHPVISYLQKIPGSEWTLVTKVDEEEIYAPVHKLAGYVAMVVAMLASTVALASWGYQKKSQYAIRHLQEQQKARELAKQVSFISKFSNDIILLLDGDGRIIDANDRAVETYGFSREELVQMEARDLWATAAYGNFENNWLRLRSEGRLLLETLHQRQDGSTLPVEASLRWLRTETGEYVQGVVRDITERKFAEQALQRVNQIYKVKGELNAAVIHLRNRQELLDSICDIAMDSGLLRMIWIGLLEPASGDVIPVASGGHLGGYLDLLHINIHDMARGRGPTGLAIINGTRVVCNDIANDPCMKPWRDAALQRGYLASAVFPIRQDGAVIGALGCYFPEAGVLDRDVIMMLDSLVVDISFALDFIAESQRRKLAEVELHKLNVALEQRVQERTLQLEVTNRELEAFSYSVSHDLRAPLRRIDGFSKILLDSYTKQLDAKGRDYLERVCRASGRMNDLIGDMLDLSRVSRVEISKKWMDLSVLARDIADGLQKSTPHRQVEFVIEDGITVYADAKLLRIMLDNLLDNAWKYTGKRGSAKIEVGTLGEGAEKAVFIRDNGAGFNMEYAHKLFSPFQRLHGAGEFEGTGIGLATVHRIVNRHGWRVWAEGREGEGATFYFAGAMTEG